MSGAFWEAIKINWIDYFIFIVLSLFFFNINLEAFLIYALIVILINIHAGVNYLRKLIRINNLVMEARTIAISDKISVKTDEVSKIIDKQTNNLSQKEIDQLKKDFSDALGRPFTWK